MMKNRRIILIAFLLCSCMIVGLGYAAYSEVLDISGTAELNADETHDGNVYFSAAQALPAEGELTTLNTANVNPNNPDKAAFTVNSVLHEGQKAQFKFTIQNDNEEAFDTAVRAYTLNDDASAYYTITCDIGTGEVDQSVDLPAMNSIDVIVTVEMVNTPEAGTLVSASFILELLISEQAAA